MHLFLGKGKNLDYNRNGEIMYTINEEVIFEYEIKKSRFISRLYPVQTVDEANEYLRLIRKKHYDATHNCYSYIIGENEEFVKQSDDNEPSQTAGVVILDALKKNQMTNVICIVTRYFGGIKLGAGGLIRAYSFMTSEAIKKAKLIEIIPYVNLKIKFNYNISNEIFKFMDKYENIDKSFSEAIICTYKVPKIDVDGIIKDLIDVSRNTITYEVVL